MSASNPSPQQAFLPPPSGVAVRMYNPGFGDCLLLAFKGNDGQPRYMLIDCGVHHQYPGHEEKVKAVAADIAAATNRRLDLVVATHEHSDHLSGFDYAREIFDDIDIEELWLSWIEDPTDKVALALKDRAHKAVEALTAVVGQLDSSKKLLGAALQGVLEFEYQKKEAGPLDYLRSKSRKKLERSEDYRRPGEVLTLPDVSGVKIYILGPPRNKPEYIHIVDDDSQLYPALQSLKEWQDFSLAAAKGSGCASLEVEARRQEDINRPFDPNLAMAPKDARKDKELGKFFRTCYGFSGAKKDGPEWRRIDCDWLGTAEQLALKLNDYTNNTSLVLAIELTETQPRKILLFAADAQAGNWLSWRDLSWPGDGKGEDKLTVENLLQRTVFYKVGHHGSRNATLSEQGLELMVSPDLVAVIPVDEAWAYAKKPQPWLHPAKTLLEKLTVRTRGRVLRSDQIPQGDRPPAQPDGASTEEWHEFTKELDWDRSPDRLWVQFTVTG
jgi:hypothetical protein